MQKSPDRTRRPSLRGPFSRLLACTLLALPAAVGCATTGGTTAAEAPPLDVEIKVGGLRPDEQGELREALTGINGVAGCEVKKEGSQATYTLRYRGTLHDLQRSIAQIPSPGLRPEEAKATLTFNGFDNKAPSLTILSPKEGTISLLEVEVVVEVPDADVARVEVGGKQASKKGPGMYATRVKLVEGQNSLPVRAVDEAGNESTDTLDVTVDSTPPDINATVKVVVEGTMERGSTVFVDGQEVPVDMLGNWRVEVIVKKGQKTVEIVAIDPNGNKKSEQRSIGVD